MPRGQHYVFAHRALPSLFENDSARLLDLLGRGGDDFLLYLWNKVGEGMEASDLVAGTGLHCEIKHLEHGLTVALVALPPPQAVPEAYFVGMVYGAPKESASSENEPIRLYLTLEKGLKLPEGTTRTVLCEWANGVHSNMGDGPEPEMEAFFTAVRGLLGS